MRFTLFFFHFYTRFEIYTPEKVLHYTPYTKKLKSQPHLDNLVINYSVSISSFKVRSISCM